MTLSDLSAVFMQAPYCVLETTQFAAEVAVHLPSCELSTETAVLSVLAAVDSGQYCQSHVTRSVRRIRYGVQRYLARTSPGAFQHSRPGCSFMVFSVVSPMCVFRCQQLWSVSSILFREDPYYVPNFLNSLEFTICDLISTPMVSVQQLMLNISRVCGAVG